MLPICQWEADHYWGQLTAAEKVLTVPYFLPARFVEKIPTRPRRNLLLFAMGTGSAMSPLLYDAGCNAVELVKALPAALAAEWDFRITGNLRPPDVLGPLGRLKPTGFVASPLPLLAEARAVAIPSDLGLGFKTKILEAILAGCWVLVTGEVHDRLPHAIRPWCLAVDPHDPAGFAEALRRCVTLPPAGDPNGLLREEAFRTLDRVLAVDASPSPPPRAGRGDHGSRLHGDPEEIATRPLGAVMASAVGGVATPRGSPYPAEERGAEDAGPKAVSIGEGRVIYHAHLKPALVRTGLLESSPAVFEYGVGAGAILKTVSEEGLTCGGVDESPARLDACRQFVPRARVLGLIDESGLCDFPGDWADFAYAVTAIQRIAKMSRVERAISEMARILKPGGYVKLRFRSGPARHPRARFFERDLLFNLEDRTVGLHLQPLRTGPRMLRRLVVPRLGVQQHDGRRGIPLSIGRLVGLFRKHRIEPISVEPDGRQQGDMFWVTGRKET
jgi:SAM-dependent methyltransferase